MRLYQYVDPVESTKKDSVFECAPCGMDIPENWNFA